MSYTAPDTYITAFTEFDLTFDSVQYNCGTLRIAPSDVIVPRTGTLDQGATNFTYAESTWTVTGTLLIPTDTPRSLPPRKVKKTCVAKDGIYSISGKAGFTQLERTGGGLGGAEYTFTIQFAGPVTETQLHPPTP